MSVECPIKIVVVGDGAVGKTSLLVTYSQNWFPEDYRPSVFANYTVNDMYEDQVVTLQLWDTAGQSDYDRLRPLSYLETNCFILCYSSVNPVSFANVESKWYPELRFHCPDTPTVLVATKIDMREDNEIVRKLQDKEQAPITYDMGKALKETIGAYDFIEASAKTQKNLKQVFNSCIRSVLHQATENESKKTKRRIKCTVC